MFERSCVFKRVAVRIIGDFLLSMHMLGLHEIAVYHQSGHRVKLRVGESASLEDKTFTVIITLKPSMFRAGSEVYRSQWFFPHFSLLFSNHDAPLLLTS